MTPVKGPAHSSVSTDPPLPSTTQHDRVDGHTTDLQRSGEEANLPVSRATPISRPLPLHKSIDDAVWTTLDNPRICRIDTALQRALLEHHDTHKYCKAVRDQIESRTIKSSSLFALLSAVKGEIPYANTSVIRSTLACLVRDEMKVVGPIAGPLWEYQGPVVVRLLKRAHTSFLSGHGKETEAYLWSYKMNQEHGVCHLRTHLEGDFYLSFTMHDVLDTGAIRVAMRQESLRCHLLIRHDHFRVQETRNGPIEGGGVRLAMQEETSSRSDRWS